MSRQISRTQLLMTLVRRELLEHRMLFLYWPVGFALLLMILAALAAAGIIGGLPQLLAPIPDPMPPEEMARLRGQLFVRSIALMPPDLMWISFWLSMVFYFLMSLYQQRKNRSILFWSSMPVPDAATIVSKLVAGLVCCQVVYLLGIFAIELAGMAGLQVYAWKENVDVASFYSNMGPPFSLPLGLLLFMPVSILWVLPVHGWLLLASAWARRMPFAWAAGPLLLLIIPEVVFKERSWVVGKLLEHTLPFDILALSRPGQWRPLGWQELLLCTVLGIALVLAAIRLNRPDDA